MELVFLFLMSSALGAETQSLSLDGLSKPIEVLSDSMRNELMTVATDFEIKRLNFQAVVPAGAQIKVEDKVLSEIHLQDKGDLRVLDDQGLNHWVSVGQWIFLSPDLRPAGFQPQEEYTKKLKGAASLSTAVCRRENKVELYPSGELLRCELVDPIEINQGGKRVLFTSIDEGLYPNGVAKEVYSHEVNDSTFFPSGCRFPLEFNHATFDGKGFVAGESELHRPLPVHYNGKRYEIRKIRDVKDCLAHMVLMIWDNLPKIGGLRVMMSKPVDDVKHADEFMDDLCKLLGHSEAARGEVPSDIYVPGTESFYDLGTHQIVTVRDRSVKVYLQGVCNMNFTISLQQ